MWETTKGLNEDILKYNAKELSNHFSRFFAEIRKSDGSKYEPDTLRVMLAVLDKHLRQKDGEFMVSRQLLEGKARIGRIPRTSLPVLSLY